MSEVKYKPDYAIHPGETLRDTLDAYDMSQRELSKRTGISEKHLTEIIRGANNITPRTALKLEKVFGVSATSWNNLQKNYEETVARIENSEKIKKDIEILPKFRSAYKSLYEIGLVDKTQKKQKRVEELQKYFAVDSLRNVEPTYDFIYYRKSNAKPDEYSVAAWLCYGEIKAREIDPPNFDAKKLSASIPKLRSLTVETKAKFLKQIEEICFYAGAAFVFLPYFAKTYLNGATRWIGGNPLIQLSDKNKYQDIFWFTFFHELCHILKHGKKEAFLEYENSKSETGKEKEADKFAQEILIKPIPYKNFVAYGNFSKSAISKLAKDIQVDKGIVAGRLAKDGNVSYEEIESLRKKI